MDRGFWTEEEWAWILGRISDPKAIQGTQKKRANEIYFDKHLREWMEKYPNCWGLVVDEELVEVSDPGEGPGFIDRFRDKYDLTSATLRPFSIRKLTLLSVA